MTDHTPTGAEHPAPSPADPPAADREGYAPPAAETAIAGPPTWHLAGYAWRFARVLTLPRFDRLLRLGGPRFLPRTARARFLAMGLPPAIVDETLASVRSVDDWADAWTGAAQRFMSAARQARAGGDPVELARARQQAALCYHVAPFFARDDHRLARASRASAVSLFAQSVAALLPDTRRVLVPWRATSLPGYLSLPPDPSGPVPLVVLLNGATTAKEELILWRAAFLERGLAVLALDWPGTGEAAGLGPASADHDDFTDGVFDLVAHDRALDAERVALIGISIGGAMAVRAAAVDRRLAACAAVTPPFDAGRWIDAVSDVVYAPLATLAGGDDEVDRLAEEFALPHVVGRLRCPLLVLGAGRDLVVPPNEAVALAAAVGDAATLVWYGDAGHALFDAYPTWTEDAARWVASLFGIEESTVPSTQVDDPPHADDAVASRRDDPVSEAAGQREFLPAPGAVERSPGAVERPPDAVERPPDASQDAHGPMPEDDSDADAAAPEDPAAAVIDRRPLLPPGWDDEFAGPGGRDAVVLPSARAALIVSEVDGDPPAAPVRGRQSEPAEAATAPEPRAADAARTETRAERDRVVTEGRAGRSAQTDPDSSSLTGAGLEGTSGSGREQALGPASAPIEPVGEFDPDGPTTPSVAVVTPRSGEGDNGPRPTHRFGRPSGEPDRSHRP
ncbi:MAG: hypothetical protein AVDCRST_MAG49-631 [uncultured Thermomicrobiales bacterium]|uniref:AB hydrolase-1 domain-containing protein n=1 Tax=uncultured Thermomicrobiales bacterium TaxID=1645740 RepID=A0A6J4U2C5_9BACT|nr:MAG: hypothetical protein AVDCRST_MAG49-631 [uncultured Thermomicrobiales bacterium]